MNSTHWDRRVYEISLFSTAHTYRYVFEKSSPIGAIRERIHTCMHTLVCGECVRLYVCWSAHVAHHCWWIGLYLVCLFGRLVDSFDCSLFGCLTSLNKWFCTSIYICVCEFSRRNITKTLSFSLICLLIYFLSFFLQIILFLYQCLFFHIATCHTQKITRHYCHHQPLFCSFSNCKKPLCKCTRVKWRISKEFLHNFHLFPKSILSVGVFFTLFFFIWWRKRQCITWNHVEKKCSNAIKKLNG